MLLSQHKKFNDLKKLYAHEIAFAVQNKFMKTDGNYEESLEAFKVLCLFHFNKMLTDAVNEYLDSVGTDGSDDLLSILSLLAQAEGGLIGIGSKNIKDFDKLAKNVCSIQRQKQLEAYKGDKDGQTSGP